MHTKLPDAVPEPWLVSLSKDIFGAIPDSVDFPGGVNRKTCLIEVCGDRYVISRRRSSARAQLEAAALHQFRDQEIAPELVALKGNIVVQAFVSGDRLSQKFDQMEGKAAAALVKQALHSITRFQEIARGSRLERLAPRIGVRSGWLEDLVAAPSRVADLISVERPTLDVRHLTEVLRPKLPSFVKWDARPGNAIVKPSGTLCWIDWEHCGLRQRSDDAAWLLADEWCPDFDEEFEKTHLLELRESATGSSSLRTMAVFHSFMRMHLILSRKADGGWWDHADCLEFDRVGVTPKHMSRLAIRASRWAEEDNALRPLVYICEEILDRLGSLPNDRQMGS